MTKHLMTKEHLFAIYSITNPIISPKQDEALFIKTNMHEEDNTYYNELWHLDFENEKITQWTYGKQKISSVQWSPNGEQISFMSSRDDKNMLYILNAKGGESRVIEENLVGVSSYVWNPNNKEIYFSAKIKSGDSFINESKEDEKKKPTAYHVQNLRYKLNGVGLLNAEKKSQIGKIDVETAAITNIMSGDANYSVETISYDGNQLVVSKYSDENDDDFANQLVLVDLTTLEERVIINDDGYFGDAAFSFDDQYIAFVGSLNEPYKNAQHSQIYVYNIVAESYYILTEAMDLPVGDYATGDIQQGATAPSVVWTKANDLYFRMSSMGDVRLYYATLNGEIYPASPEEEHVYGYDVTHDGVYALLAISTTTSVGEIFKVNISTGERKKLTFFNEQFEQETIIVKPEIINFENEGNLVWGWFMKPANFEEGKKYPLIVNIHGGPHMMYANTFVHEMQLLAAQGYAVLYMNPRGGQSYSQQFVNGCRFDYGGGDYRDIMTGVDAMIEEHSFIDVDRLGVTGGSYGGFMTNWIVGHTDRFKAALTQRSISNWISFYGVSDIGYYFTPWQIGADMTDVAKLWEHSPLKYAENVNTPLMIIHSEEDYRCPIEQAEQLFITLKRLGKEASFVRFPQADHDLSRSGLPNLRLERLEVITDWFDKKL